MKECLYDAGSGRGICFVSLFYRVVSTLYINADVAQLVEQLIRNEQVTGSIPAIGSICC